MARLQSTYRDRCVGREREQAGHCVLRLKLSISTASKPDDEAKTTTHSMLNFILATGQKRRQ